MSDPTSKPKFLFLDFDGVCCTNRTYKAWRALGSPKTMAGYLSLFDQNILALINNITDLTGAQIIASTSWRLPDTLKGGITFADLFPLIGFTAPLAGQTPDTMGHRGQQIALYIQQASLSIDQFIILDDDQYAGMAPKTGDFIRHGGRWIQTAEATGLTAKQALKAIKLLNCGGMMGCR